MKKIILLLACISTIFYSAGLRANYIAICVKQLDVLKQFKNFENYKKVFGIAGNGLLVFSKIDLDLLQKKSLQKVWKKPFSAHSISTFYSAAGALFALAVILRVILEVTEIKSRGQIVSVKEGTNTIATQTRDIPQLIDFPSVARVPLVALLI